MCKMQLKSWLGLLTDFHPQENPVGHSKVYRLQFLDV